MNASEDNDLVKLEQRALAHQNKRQPAEAITLWVEVLRREPGWEHGYADYNLACCLEDVGNLDQARQSFQRALSHDSHNAIFLGGYASFLFIHGGAQEAFDTNCELLALELRRGDTRTADKVASALATLGQKLGVTEELVQAKIREIRHTERRMP